MIAGANFTVISGGVENGWLDIVPGQAASTTGGYIQLGNLNASSTIGWGGNVTLIANAGTGAGSGVITFSSINTSGASSGNNNIDGNVTIIAGATSGATSIGSSNGGTATITASGGSGQFAQVTLGTATPILYADINVDPSGNVYLSGVSSGEPAYVPGTTQTPGIANINITCKLHAYSRYR